MGLKLHSGLWDPGLPEEGRPICARHFQVVGMMCGIWRFHLEGQPSVKVWQNYFSLIFIQSRVRIFWKKHLIFDIIFLWINLAYTWFFIYTLITASHCCSNPKITVDTKKFIKWNTVCTYSPLLYTGLTDPGLPEALEKNRSTWGGYTGLAQADMNIMILEIRFHSGIVMLWWSEG